MFGEIIITGHVHLEIIERMGDAHAGYIESDHAANFSHDPHGCRLILGIYGSAETTKDDHDIVIDRHLFLMLHAEMGIPKQPNQGQNSGYKKTTRHPELRSVKAGAGRVFHHRS